MALKHVLKMRNKSISIICLIIYFMFFKCDKCKLVSTSGDSLKSHTELKHMALENVLSVTSAHLVPEPWLQ